MPYTVDIEDFDNLRDEVNGVKHQLRLLCQYLEVHHHYEVNGKLFLDRTEALDFLKTSLRLEKLDKRYYEGTTSEPMIGLNDFPNV